MAQPSKQKPYEPLSVINISPQSNLLIIARSNSPSLPAHDMSVKHTVTENGSILCRDHGWLKLDCSGLCLEWHTS